MESENTGSVYPLTEGERGVMQKLHIGVVNAKARAYDAQADLVAAKAAFDGALGILANSHGLGGGQLISDFAAIVKV